MRDGFNHSKAVASGAFSLKRTNPSFAAAWWILLVPGKFYGVILSLHEESRRCHFRPYEHTEVFTYWMRYFLLFPDWDKNMSITVFLADDHKMVREGFRLLLQTQPDIRVIGEAGTGRDAVRQVKNLKPEVVLMDIAMPELNGIEATQQICEACPTTKVIILSMYSTSQHIFRAIKAGARGYILKESAGDDAIAAVRSVHSGQIFLCKEISETVVRDYVQKRDLAEALGPLARLSHRERQILQLLVEGTSNTKIADLLFLSPKTVETYRSHLMQKLGISDLPALVKFAIHHGLTSLE
jgi:DNA-binding NarL/FixJ family response regulator